MPDRDRIPDDFWDIEDLLPQKSPRKTPVRPAASPEAVEIELSPREAQTPASSSAPDPVRAAPLTVKAGETALPSGSKSPAGANTSPAPARPDLRKTEELDENTPLADYQPDGVLIHRVRIYGWQANYHYFDQFADDAVRYAAMKPPAEARPESFFSYFPQYVQMSRRSTNWYLYWREGVRRDTYMDTDYAYVLLYLFELINLPTPEPAIARAHRDLMAKVWMAYRRSYPQLDHYMCEWLCDYCLIHGLTAPIDLLAPALDDIILGSRLKEFYLSAAVRVPAAGNAPDTAMETARILMRHCCQYDYHKSKFASGEHKALYDKTIPAAVASAIPLLLGADGQKPAITMLDSTLTRDAYTGALCSYRNKRRIEVSYTSFSRSHELRFLIGDMVKHVENRIRGWIGVRSRLSVMSLPIPLRDALDRYLAPLEPPKSALPVKKKEPPRPSYEALYDLPAKPVSVEDAAAIEADSWETTKILVEAFEGGEGPAAEAFPAAPENIRPPRPADIPVTVAPAPLPSDGALPPIDAPPSAGALPSADPSSAADGWPSPDTEGWSAALAPYRAFLEAVMADDPTAQKRAAAALGKMPDAIADEINTITADADLPGNPICDILLEDDGTGRHKVIEDYIEYLELR